MQQSLEQLIQALTELPGIGRKTAQRIAFYLLKQREFATELAGAITTARERLRECRQCLCLTEDELCSICSDKSRDHSTICVVEEFTDVLTLEQTRLYRGTYHVLGGVLSPIDNIGPDDLHITQLIERVAAGGVNEVILATNPTVEGEATAVYIARRLQPLSVKVTRLARGLPAGSDLDLADNDTISRALEGRRELPLT